MKDMRLPQGYKPLLSIYETQKAIDLGNRLFADKLAGAQQALEQQKKSLPPEDGRRLDGLLRGAEAASEEEAPLAGQVGANQRLLRQLVDMDRVVNRKLAREKTVYQ